VVIVKAVVLLGMTQYSNMDEYGLPREYAAFIFMVETLEAACLFEATVFKQCLSLGNCSLKTSDRLQRGFHASDRLRNSSLLFSMN
jgi:hypothetical protein